MTISKTESWKYSIDITFNPYKNIDYVELFKILKFYFNNETIFCITIATCWKINGNEIITDVVKNENFNKKNFINFKEWLYYRFFHDKKYDPDEKAAYSLRLTFSKKIIDAYNSKNECDILSELRPLKIYKKKPKKMQKIYKIYPFLKRIK